MIVKEQIVNQAMLLFRQMGIRSVTMDMIAEQTGISKRTLYENFSNKDELVEACVMQEIESRKEQAKRILEGSSHIIETYILFMWDHINRLRGTSPLFIKDIQKLYPQSICKQTNEFNNRMRENTKQFIIMGINDGVFRKEINPDIASILIFEQIKVLHVEGGFEASPLSMFSPAEVFEHISINFIRGISTSKGLELVDFYYSKHKMV
ncbi:MAG: TetR/AcrR family transcriptional regulator [Bacteroidales bacterium]|nr:TetR/AcrR family transcriptional regulator [Bacteroidales bacterium]